MITVHMCQLRVPVITFLLYSLVGVRLKRWNLGLETPIFFPILRCKSVDHNKQWKILKEMGITGHLTCLLRNLYAGQEETVRTGHGTTDWFQIGKGVRQGCILSPC